MKRIDITGSAYYSIIDKLSIRPSVKEKIRRQLHDNDIWKIRDLCQITEEEAKPLFFYNDILFSSVKDYLISVGLHFGMTEDNLVDYMDADFLESLTNSNYKQEKEESDEKEYNDIYIRVKKKDWEEAYAAKNTPSKESLIKEVKEELCAKIMRFFLFLLMISLPLGAMIYFLRETFNTDCPQIENIHRYEPKYSWEQSHAQDYKSLMDSIETRSDKE